MTRFAVLAVVSLLGLGVSHAIADDGGTGFWVTLWPPATSGAVIILCGAFCAKWAQNTGRNAWLWFLLGAAFSVVTLAVLLYLNAEGRRTAPPHQRTAEPGAAPARGHR
jgi:ABC-type Mn2+/Zn2+ transport system permease subunit